MVKKYIFLLLALIVPVMVFCFLKFFGRNEFSVTPLFQEKGSKYFDCPGVSFPFFISDTTYKELKRNFENDSLLVIYCQAQSSDSIAAIAQLKRFEDSFSDVVGLKKIFSTKKNLECTMLLQAPLDLVLIDGKKRIRGQYNSTDRDDVDRLMTELDIILKRY